MTAYVTDVVAGVIGNFPSVYVSGTRSGPFHRAVHPGAFLGRAVSAERNADQLPDEDALTNLAPDEDAADRDFADDSRAAALGLEYSCAEASLTYTVTIESGFESGITLIDGPGTTTLPEPAEGTEVVYINAWLDLDRDGTWEGVDHCATVRRYSEGRGYWVDPLDAPVSEWVIQDLALSLAPGTHVITTTIVTLPITEALEIAPTWLRITLGDRLGGGQDATQNNNVPQNGRGPADGHPFGETEDIKLFWRPNPNIVPRAWWSG